MFNCTSKAWFRSLFQLQISPSDVARAEPLNKEGRATHHEALDGG